jgi:glucose-6-phosphate 1-dehydrogenase
VIRLRSGRTKRPDLIRFGIRPRPDLTFDLSVQDPDPPHHHFPAPAGFDAATVFGRRQRLPYETILHAVVDGDRTPFVPFPCIEESWRIVGKVIDTGRTPIGYAPGTWGPQEAQRLVGGDDWCDL